MPHAAPAQSISFGIRTLALVLLLVALVAATFAPVLDNNFVNFDDYAFITENPDFNPSDWGAIFRYFRGPYFGGAFPLTYVFVGGLSELARSPDGIDPRVFHAASIVLHAACAV